MPILVDTGELAGLAVEGPLYGIFLCMVVVCGYDLYRRARRGETRLSWPMVATGTSLILLATVRFILNAAYIFLAFIRHDTRAERIAFFGDLHQPIFIARHVIFLMVQFIGDSFVTYRCWVVWGKDYRVAIIPLILTVLGNASGSYTVWTFTNLPNQTELTQALWIKLCFCLSLAGNFLATSLLAFRIWLIDREVQAILPARSTSLMPVMRIILESGLINVAYLFAFVLVVEFGPEAFELMCDMGVSLTGIVFTIVILRAALGRHHPAKYTARAITFPWKLSNARPETEEKQPADLHFKSYDVGSYSDVSATASTSLSSDAPSSTTKRDTSDELDVYAGTQDLQRQPSPTPSFPACTAV